VAQQWYRSAARHQTAFYGQLAVSALKSEFRPPQQLPPEKTLPGKQAFDRKELVRAAHFLDEAGMNDETSDMLNTLAANVKTPEDYRLTAELAEALGHPQNAVKIAKNGLNKGILLMDQLYPTMLSRMRNVRIEWALVHALIRQESSFDVRAQSPAGAMGLMQLMPATAQHVANRNHIGYRPDLLVTDPDYNIQLGSLYFKQLLDKYNNSYPLALAAYNGGPGRVDGWLAQFGDPRLGKIDAADWIELIPVAETRNYVQRVLEGVYIYRLKLNGAQKSFFSASRL
jgi:soluble lytic murein transglycosylase